MLMPTCQERKQKPSTARFGVKRASQKHHQDTQWAARNRFYAKGKPHRVVTNLFAD
jgi:hypothetical protein